MKKQKLVTKKKYISQTILFLVLFVFVSATTIQFARNYAQEAYSMQTVTYCTPAQQPLQVDIYTPTDLEKPAPLIIFAHGGGWLKGTRQLEGYQKEIMEALVKKGFIYASIDYRLVPDGDLKSMLEDVKCSIRFMRAHAAEYNVDPTRVALAGASAGGHLVSLTGLSNKWNVGEYIEQPVDVKAILDIYGPTDLTKPEFFNMERVEVLAYFLKEFGMKLRPELSEFSPLDYISTTPNAHPPFLIIHGDKDLTVNPSQSLNFYNKLQEASQSANLLLVQNASHGFDTPVPATAVMNPAKAVIIQTIVDFFLAYLGDPKLEPTGEASPSGIVLAPTFVCLGGCITYSPPPPFTPVPSVNISEGGQAGQNKPIFVQTFWEAFLEILRGLFELFTRLFE